MTYPGSRDITVAAGHGRGCAGAGIPLDCVAPEVARTGGLYRGAELKIRQPTRGDFLIRFGVFPERNSNSELVAGFL